MLLISEIALIRAKEQYLLTKYAGYKNYRFVTL